MPRTDDGGLKEGQLGLLDRDLRKKKSTKCSARTAAMPISLGCLKLG